MLLEKNKQPAFHDMLVLIFHVCLYWMWDIVASTDRKDFEK